jgi:hypothetical protein
MRLDEVKEATGWKISDLGSTVRIKGEKNKTVYRLEAISRDAPSGELRVKMVSIVPSPRPGVNMNYALAGIEKVKA